MAFNEDETRRYLIDRMLTVPAGMLAQEAFNERCRQRITRSNTQVGPSGKGNADYVLKDDNDKPLGVIEAKKTSRDPGSAESRQSSMPMVWRKNTSSVQ